MAPLSLYVYIYVSIMQNRVLHLYMHTTYVLNKVIYTHIHMMCTLSAYHSWIYVSFVNQPSKLRSSLDTEWFGIFCRI